MEALQLSLLSSAEMPAPIFSVLEGKGVYTGARLRTQRPEVYAQCVALLHEGVTPLQIEDALGIEHRTVEAVAAANSIPISTSKRRMAERFRFAADRLLDKVHETDDAREAKDLMIGASCAADKWQLLEGQPTSRSVDIEVKVDASDWNGWIDSAKETPRANGPVLEAVLVPGGLAESAPGDSQSVGAPCAGEGCAVGLVDCIPESPETTAQGSADGGGGGQGSDPPPATEANASGGGNFHTKGVS